MRLPSTRELTTPIAIFTLGAAAAVAAVAAFRHVGFAQPRLDSLWSWPFRIPEVVGTGLDDVTVITVYEPIALARNVVLIFAGGLASLLGLHRLLVALGLEGEQTRADRDVAVFDAAQKKLEAEIGNALKLFRSQVEITETHSAALERGQSSLEASDTREQVRMVIKHLVSENERMRRNNAEYARKLEDSRSQIESLRAALSESREVTARDSLTNAYSRRHFDATLPNLVKEAHKCNTALSLILTDLDNFKNINDTFGHPVGDDVLKNFVALMMANTKGGDCVARYGGEEFAIVLPSMKLADAAKTADVIRRKLQAQEWAVKGGPRLGSVTASFGVCQLGKNEAAAALIERADAKLYASKAAGRNRVTP
jgi:diguanylate cyclase